MVRYGMPMVNYDITNHRQKEWSFEDIWAPLSPSKRKGKKLSTLKCMCLFSVSQYKHHWYGFPNSVQIPVVVMIHIVIVHNKLCFFDFFFVMDFITNGS
ncbi:hypothetical protein M514_27795 [Trichuris suis]|uniref:Uncharacterized protein n=1 Tax=Trichuris suis TaxID=68888 RepID=A0A085MS33_9BILA|nr:hypothetical protein M514_27795 [Trichuris suis]